MEDDDLSFEYHVKLAFPLDSGHYVIEYIPRDYTAIEDWFHARLDSIRVRINAPLYYWNIRWLLLPPVRKLYDIHFLLHMDLDHEDSTPSFIERFHAWRIRRRYRHEMPILHKLLREGISPDIRSDVMFLDKEYLIIYNKKWIESFKEDNNWRILYHGVDLDESVDLLDLLIYKNNKRKNQQ